MTEVDNTLERVEKYQSIIDHAARVVVTADLDYATAHAASRRYFLEGLFWDTLVFLLLIM